MVRKVKELNNVMQSQSSPLAALFRKGKALAKLNTLAKELLGNQLRGDSQIMNIRGNTLIIGTKNSSIATRLRYEVKAIKLKLNAAKEFQHIEKIEIKIMPEMVPLIQNNPKPVMDEASRECIDSLANDIQDENLSAVLKRLASVDNKQ